MKVIVHYDAGFCRPGTWMLSPDGDGIRARFRLGAADELVVDAQLRWLRQAGGARVYIYPIDAAHSTWLTESSRFPSKENGDPQVGVRINLQINGCPEHVAEVLRTF